MSCNRPKISLYTWVYHFDAKADATEYIKDTYSKLWEVTSVIQGGGYLPNHQRFPGFIPQKADGGVYEVNVPFGGKAKFPCIAVDLDTGVFVRALVIEVPAGKNLVAYREQLTISDFLSIWSKVNGVPSRCIETPFEEYIKAGNDARELAETAAYVAEFGFEGRGDPTVVYPKDVSHPCICTCRYFADLFCPIARRRLPARHGGRMDQTTRLVECFEAVGEAKTLWPVKD